MAPRSLALSSSAAGLCCALSLALGAALPPGSVPRSGGEFWALCTGNSEEPNGSLARIDVDSGTVLERRVLAGPAGERLPNDFVFDADGSRILAAQLSNAPGEPVRTELQTIDRAGATVTSSRRIDGWLDGLARHPVSGKLWGTYLTPGESQRKLVRVNWAQAKVQILGALPPELFPRGLAFTPDGSELWALLGPNQPHPEGLLRLNPNNGEILVQWTWPLPDSPLALEFDRQGRLLVYAYDGRIYSVDRTSGALALVSTVANPIQHIIMGFEPVPSGADRR